MIKAFIQKYVFEIGIVLVVLSSFGYLFFQFTGMTKSDLVEKDNEIRININVGQGLGYCQKISNAQEAAVCMERTTEFEL